MIRMWEDPQQKIQRLVQEDMGTTYPPNLSHNDTRTHVGQSCLSRNEYESVSKTRPYIPCCCITANLSHASRLIDKRKCNVQAARRGSQHHFRGDRSPCIHAGAQARAFSALHTTWTIPTIGTTNECTEVPDWA